MNLQTPTLCGRRPRPLDALSAIELIGVLAVIAVLAGVLVPVAIRIIDRIVAEREVATLAKLGDSFRSGILRSRQIPAPANWASLMATEAGMNLVDVTQNARRVQRAILYDKGGWLATGLPYSQTTTPPGLGSLPSKPRIMIVSSLGAALPAKLNNTDMLAADFEALWSTAENVLPTGTGSPWLGWGGRPDDVKIQRINLTPLFVNLVLSTYLGTTNGLYSIDNSVIANNGYYPAPWNEGVARYFLKGTLLQLYAPSPAFVQQHSTLLDNDTSFVYENGIWRSSIVGAAAVGVGDVTGIVEAFLKAPANQNAEHKIPPKIQQLLIVSNFTAYMSNYNLWADGTDKTSGTADDFKNTVLHDHLKLLQPKMIQSLEGLFLYTGGTDNRFPVNTIDPCAGTVQP